MRSRSVVMFNPVANSRVADACAVLLIWPHFKWARWSVSVCICLYKYRRVLVLVRWALTLHMLTLHAHASRSRSFKVRWNQLYLHNCRKHHVCTYIYYVLIACLSISHRQKSWGGYIITTDTESYNPTIKLSQVGLTNPLNPELFSHETSFSLYMPLTHRISISVQALTPKPVLIITFSCARTLCPSVFKMVRHI